MEWTEARVVTVLTQFAREHLEHMRKVDWDSLAKHLDERYPRGGGEAFGCEEDGRYFDVGDKVEWLGRHGGDISLTTYATTRFNDEDRTESCTIVIARR
jgi:hypothetical protein